MDRAHLATRGPAETEKGSDRLPDDPVTLHLDALSGRHGTDLGAGLAAGVSLTLVQTGEVVMGRDAVTVIFAELHRQAFAAKTTARSRTVQGGQTVVEATYTGRHVAEFAGIPPSGNVVNVPYVVAYETEAGEIVTIRAYFPFEELIRQLRGGGPWADDRPRRDPIYGSPTTDRLRIRPSRSSRRSTVSSRPMAVPVPTTGLTRTWSPLTTSRDWYDMGDAHPPPGIGPGHG